ncbi:MAG TPA: DUF6527 family protein [Candidatus Acidoferrales bacterium]|nr:DUF6527 family protein [Candidatus Acidoferrales bacterium]
MELDLGENHKLRFVGWRPDRSVNPQFDGIPDVDKYGAIIEHRKPDGTRCAGMIVFDGDVSRRIEPDRERWTVESWDPLTISPSVLCTDCGDHGFIREGKWVKA